MGVYINDEVNTMKEQHTVRTNEEKEAIIRRLARLSGQINGVKRMVEEDRYCADILTQLAAINKAIRSLSSVLISRHMKTCVVNKIKEGNDEVIDEAIELFKKFDL